MKILPCPWGCKPIAYYNCRKATKAKCPKHSKLALPLEEWNRRVGTDHLIDMAYDEEELKP